MDLIGNDSDNNSKMDKFIKKMKKKNDCDRGRKKRKISKIISDDESENEGNIVREGTIYYDDMKVDEISCSGRYEGPSLFYNTNRGDTFKKYLLNDDIFSQSETERNNSKDDNNADSDVEIMKKPINVVSDDNSDCIFDDNDNDESTLGKHCGFLNLPESVILEICFFLEMNFVSKSLTLLNKDISNITNTDIYWETFRNHWNNKITDESNPFCNQLICEPISIGDSDNKKYKRGILFEYQKDYNSEPLSRYIKLPVFKISVYHNVSYGNDPIYVESRNIQIRQYLLDAFTVDKDVYKSIRHEGLIYIANNDSEFMKRQISRFHEELRKPWTSTNQIHNISRLTNELYISIKISSKIKQMIKHCQTLQTLHNFYESTYLRPESLLVRMQSSNNLSISNMSIDPINVVIESPQYYLKIQIDNIIHWLGQDRYVKNENMNILCKWDDFINELRERNISPNFKTDNQILKVLDDIGYYTHNINEIEFLCEDL